MANQFFGKALSHIPALKPYRGKLAVRNLRGGDGNVGIIRSPISAIALPDNRHEGEDERALQERSSSDPLGLESCAATALVAVAVGVVGEETWRNRARRRLFAF
jgi:hypothetical protein